MAKRNAGPYLGPDYPGAGPTIGDRWSWTTTPTANGGYTQMQTYSNPNDPSDLYPGNDAAYLSGSSKYSPAQPRSNWATTDDPSQWQSTPMQQQSQQNAVYTPSAASPWTGQQAPATANPQGQLLTGTATTQPQQQYAGMNTAGHPFYDPNQDYSNTGQPSASFDPNSLAFMNWATNESPEGYYFGLLNQLGLGGLDAKSQAAQAMYRDYARGYQAAKAKNIELWFPQFMDMQNIPWQIDQLSNNQLGVNNADYAGRDRWALRGY